MNSPPQPTTPHSPSPATTAEITARSSASDHDLRVPCYCEENVWRLAHRRLYREGDGGGRSCDDDGDDDDDNGDGDGDRRGRSFRYHVVFVSNDAKCCPFRMQRAARSTNDNVCWDYHVILIREVIDSVDGSSSSTSTSSATARTEVLDLDTRLPYPCPLDEYLDGSFPHARDVGDGEGDGGGGRRRLASRYWPHFRVVPANAYLQYFYSDRMHMLKDGKWSSPPPEYEPIMNGLSYVDDEDDRGNGEGGSISNLDRYVNMSEDGSKSNIKQNGDGIGQGKWGMVYSLDQLCARFSNR